MRIEANVMFCINKVFVSIPCTSSESVENVCLRTNGKTNYRMKIL